MRRLMFPLLVLLALASPLPAEIKLPKTLTDHAVLQRGVKVPIWGVAAPNEKVTVTFNGQTLDTRADGEGDFRVELAPMQAGGPFELIVAAPSGTVKVTDILIGDVWVCSGQSNMQWSVAASNDAQEEIKAASHAQIRLMTVPNQLKPVTGMTVNAAWSVCDPQTVGGFSAVGYFFGRELQREVCVPIGLIANAWGGTPAQAWTSREALASEPALKVYLDREAAARAAFAEWKTKSDELKAQGQPVPTQPAPPRDPDGSPHTPSILYHAMLAPVTDFPIKGVIWYQGESNVSEPALYRTLFPTMIRDWRRAWGQGDFPFLFVQLANYTPALPEPGESNWAELREAQTLALSEPSTGMAVAIDIGEAGDIHPRNKQDVGKRLSLAALKVAYGKDVAYSGPMFDSMSVEGDTARLKFRHADGGLTVKGEKLRGFAIAGTDGKFYWADAKLDPATKDTVLVRSDKVNAPAAARYNWANNPDGNLHNGSGLPAVPFRTDAPR